MKKILIGICGLGNGHINRQKSIINKLIERGHQIILFVTKENIKTLDQIFPSIKKIIVKIPWVYCDQKGINFKKTKARYLRDGLDWYREMLSVFIKVQQEFDGNPDLVITDYEPNSAQFSYATGLPLICFEQQSKFMGYKFENIGKFSPNEEISRLNYFFPTAKKRYVPSFFPLEDQGNYNVESIPPIIDQKASATKVNFDKVVVYFSPYGKKEKKFIDILNVLKRFQNYKFHIYSAEKFNKYSKYDNLFFKKISNDFKTDLIDCNFVISTAGHQLISEAINLNKPVLLSPFNTFEQNYNVKMVIKYSLGEKFDPISTNKLLDFIDKLDYYRGKIKSFKNSYWKNNWENVLLKKLEREFGL